MNKNTKSTESNDKKTYVFPESGVSVQAENYAEALKLEQKETEEKK